MKNRRSGVKRADPSVSSTTIATRTKIIKLENHVKVERVEEPAYFCPECGRKYEPFDKFWIQCDNCAEWYHGDCVYVQPHQAYSLDKFYCRRCEAVVGQSTIKKVTNNHRHNIYEESPSHKIQSGTTAFVEMLKAKMFVAGEYPSLQGKQLSINYLLKNGFCEPILVEEETGLDMLLPPGDFGVEQVMDFIGGYTELDVIDSKRQLSIKMPFVEFTRYISTEVRDRTLNSISLEVSKTRLGEIIKPPGIVCKLSWVENGWPEVDMKPNVSKYCLMSMKDSYTDFHIDFGGTSVWYHVLKGEKVFYLIEPSPDNIDIYERWMNRPDQSEIFLVDLLPSPSDCKKLTLSQGQTLFIPTGWIHAVLTTKDSLVFGGNFLHSLNIGLQLAIYELENRLRTADKFLFPYFELTHWYAIPLVCKLLNDSFNKKPPRREIIEGTNLMLTYLRKWYEKSKQENSIKNGDFSPYAPKGSINPTKMMAAFAKSLRAVSIRYGFTKSRNKSKEEHEEDILDDEETIENDSNTDTNDS